jgi:hypothetical protein
MTLGQIWIYDKFVEQLSELPLQKIFCPGKGGRDFGQNGHIIKQQGQSPTQYLLEYQHKSGYI